MTELIALTQLNSYLYNNSDRYPATDCSIERLKDFDSLSIDSILLDFIKNENNELEKKTYQQSLIMTQNRLDSFLKEDNMKRMGVEGSYLSAALMTLFTKNKVYSDPLSLKRNVAFNANEWIKKAKEGGIDTTQYKERLDELLANPCFNANEIYYKRFNPLTSILMKLYTVIENPSRAESFTRELKSRLVSSGLKDITFEELLDSVYTKPLNIVTEIKENIVKPLEKAIRTARPELLITDADNYRDALNKIQSTSDIGNFIGKKIEKDVNYTVEMSKGQTYQWIKIFPDKSLLVKDRNDALYAISNIHDANHVIKNHIFPEYLEFKLRKKPTYAKFFSNYYKKEQNPDITGAVIAVNKFIETEPVLKNMGIDIKTTPFRSFEAMDDFMSEQLREHKIQQFTNSIISNKYRHLCSEKTDKLFRQLYDENTEQATIQNFIGKKIASCKNTEDFEKLITGFINISQGFHLEGYLARAQKVSADILFNQNELLILKIDSFEQSKTLGSGSWCISRDSHYYNSYTSEDKKQFFAYDFSKESNDNNSMIGITLEDNGTFYTAHLKNDEFSNKENVMSIQRLIIANNFDMFPEVSPHVIEQLGLKESYDNYNKSNKPKMMVS